MRTGALVGYVADQPCHGVPDLNATEALRTEPREAGDDQVVEAMVKQSRTDNDS
jgi:hypothetical protein